MPSFGPISVYGGLSGIVGLLAFLFWAWMLIDAIRWCPSRDNLKLIWVLVIVFLSLLGAILYFVIQRPKNARTG